MLTIASIQLNPKVGDIEYNITLIRDAYLDAVSRGAELVVFSEMIVTGYPPEDLILRQQFQQLAQEATKSLAMLTDRNHGMIIGNLDKKDGVLYNAAFLLTNGIIDTISHKHHLPNYGVFDEKRIFSKGNLPTSFEFKGITILCAICEDMWQSSFQHHLKKQHPDLVISIHASPFETNKHAKRLDVIRNAAKLCQAPIFYTNQLGGQDELVFDGGSFAVDKNGTILFQQPWYASDCHITLLEKSQSGLHITSPTPSLCELPIREDRIYQALVLGLRDYVTKNHFKSVVIGMSGGIDSALCAAIAVDALGKDAVELVMMPSIYTSEQSKKDAHTCAKNLGITLKTIPIHALVETFNTSLAPFFIDTQKDITEENLQSRIRAVLLMALSNKFGHMLLTTGNKSELAVGYATLYGDMCGGFNVLKDIYKVDVYKLTAWRNSTEIIIPKSIIEREPTAELRAEQKDQDSLPDYEILDRILHYLLEDRLSIDEIISNHKDDKETVGHIARLVRLAEYKRRQAPPGIKITPLAFGKDRRCPITNGYRF